MQSAVSRIGPVVIQVRQQHQSRLFNHGVRGQEGRVLRVSDHDWVGHSLIQRVRNCVQNNTIARWVV